MLTKYFMVLDHHDTIWWCGTTTLTQYLMVSDHHDTIQWCETTIFTK
jgi:hypothetical protein